MSINEYRAGRLQGQTLCLEEGLFERRVAIYIPDGMADDFDLLVHFYGVAIPLKMR